MRPCSKSRSLPARGLAAGLAAAFLLLLVPSCAADGGDGGPVHVPIMLVLGPVGAGPLTVTAWASQNTGVGVGVCWHFSGGPPPGRVGVVLPGDGVVVYVPSVGPDGWQPAWPGPGDPPIIIDGYGTGTQEAGYDPSC